MSKKIGMLSFHESLSYGGTLQCFALQKIVRELGFDAEFIDFQRKKCTDYHRIKTKVSIKDKIKSLLIKSAVKVQNVYSNENNKLVDKAFKEFKKEYFRISAKEYNSIADIYSSTMPYDIYITGSDQVWNPYSNFLEVYGLGFAPATCNKIAYAASIGVSEIPEAKKEFMYNLIKSVNHVSCREYEGADALTKLLKRNVVNVLDPTLLLNKSQWSGFAKRITVPKQFVLCFFLGSLDYPRRIAKSIARKNNMELIVIPGSPKDLISSGTIAKGVGPQEFLYLFNNADFICTDSFHGTAFAVNLNKPFYSFCRRGYNEKTSYISRIRDLLEIVGLSDRLVYPDCDITYDITHIDYSRVNIVLNKEREKSISFLCNSLAE